MKKNIVFCFLFSFLWLLFSAAPVFSETFEEYRERTRREQEDQRRRRQNEEQDDEDDDASFCEGIAGCLKLFSILGEISDNENDHRNDQPQARPGDPAPAESPEEEPADQPPPDRSTPDFADPVHEPVLNAVFPYAPGGDKFWAVELRGNVPFLFAGDGLISGFAPQVNITFDSFHLNASYERLMDSTGYIDTFAFHAGFAVPLERILVAIYAGVFIEPSIPYTGFSFGAQMRIYVTENVMWTLDGFCSLDGSIFYTGGSTTVGFIIDRFVLGAGVDLKNFNGMFMWGPSINLSLWM